MANKETLSGVVDGPVAERVREKVRERRRSEDRNASVSEIVRDAIEAYVGMGSS